METQIEKPLAVAYKRNGIIFAALIILIAAAIFRSSVTTGLDSFTYDEAYHIGAGANYVQTGDFRLNPEQPPLTKLWVGTYVTLKGYKISPFRAFSDKEDERGFVEQDAYFNNDPFVLQSDARTAMFALNGLLMLIFALAVWRVFGPIMAVGTTIFLAIDPTVAAHMPVVMTDLPIALTSGIAVMTSMTAFRSWRVVDLALAAIGVGLALSAKHSGIITLIVVAGIGVFAAFFSARGMVAGRPRRFASVSAVVIGGVIVLWAFYGFRYNESPGVAEETFNRSLSEKASDIRSPLFRNAVYYANALHVFPRAYTWGMADTIRAGVEGRAIQVRAFGTEYYAKGPFYFFPGIVAAKLPIGLLVLSLVGFVLFAIRRLPSEFVFPTFGYIAFALIFLGFLIRGSSYAGIRHALPLIPFAALFGAVAIHFAVKQRSIILRGMAALLLIAAAVSALPQMRPWEYFNEIAGGATNGSSYFNDEGVDLSQRIGEVAAYYSAELEPRGDVPLLMYFSNSNDRRSRGMDWVGHDQERDQSRMSADTFTGTVMIGANELSESAWWDVGKPFRGTEPLRRMGNIFVFQGTFDRPKAAIARSIFYRTIYSAIYANEPDPKAAIDGIERSVALDDSCFFVHLELGNQYLKIGDRENALRAFRAAYERAPVTDSIYDLLAEQVRRLESDESLEDIASLRNPGIE